MARHAAGASGSNQYRQRGASAGRKPSRSSGAAISDAVIPDEQLERAAWSFAPNSEQAWAWAFPGNLDAQQTLSEMGFADAVTALDIVGTPPGGVDLATWASFKSGGGLVSVPPQRLLALSGTWDKLSDQAFPNLEFIHADTDDNGTTMVSVSIDGAPWEVYDEPDIGHDRNRRARDCDGPDDFGMFNDTSPGNVLGAIGGYDPDDAERFGSALEETFFAWDNIRYNHGTEGLAAVVPKAKEILGPIVNHRGGS